MPLLVFCPFFAMAVSWIAGRLVITGLAARVPSESLATVLGASILLVVAGDVSFLGEALNRPVALGLVSVLAAAVVLRRRTLFRDIDHSEVAIVALLCCVSLSYFLLPSFRHGADVVLLEAGDYSSYASMGSWLQGHAIGIPADLGAGYSPVQFKLADHQVHHLRLGALFLYALYASIFGVQTIVLYTSYTSWLVALQVVAFHGLARAVIPRSRAWPCAVASIAFALNPLLTWSGYASFVPQVLGIALMMAIVAAAVDIIDAVFDGSPLPALRPSLAALGVLACANWSAYPEIMPVALAILGFYAAITAAQRRIAPGRIGVLALGASASLVLAVLLSPMTAAWGLKGLVDQIHMNPHGGEQVIGAWTVLGSLAGASLEPLIPAALDRMTALQFACGGVIAVAALLGILHVARSGRAPLVLAVAVTAVLLFFYVGHRYGYDPQHMAAESRALLTWNYFKAIQYVAPMSLLLGWAGAGHLLGKPFGRGWRRACGYALSALPVVAVGVLASGQWARVEASASYLDIRPQAVEALSSIPPGRVLVSTDGDGAFDVYRRWAIYASMPDKGIVTTDGVSDYDERLARMPEFLGVPIAYTIRDAPPETAALTPFAGRGIEIADVSRKDLPFVVSSENVSRWYVSAPRSGEGTVAVSNVAVPNVLMTTSAGDRSFPVGTLSSVVADAASLSTGGLIHIEASPPQDGLVVSTGPAPDPDAEFARLRQISDLTPQVDQRMIADGGGGTMSWQRRGSGFELTMRDFGFSRLLLRPHLKPGKYYLKVELADVSSEAQPGTSGFGAYIGFDNHRETAVDLAHAGNSTFYYRFVVPQEGDVACGIGFGAWGAARGRMHVRAVALMAGEG